MILFFFDAVDAQKYTYILL